MTYNPIETDSQGGFFFWLYEEGNNDGSKQTSASSRCVRSNGLKREHTTMTTILTFSKYVLFVIYATNLCLCQLRGCHLVNDA